MLERSSVRRISVDAGSFKIEIERAFAKGGALVVGSTAAGAATASARADAGTRVVPHADESVRLDTTPARRGYTPDARSTKVASSTVAAALDPGFGGLSDVAHYTQLSG